MPDTSPLAQALSGRYVIERELGQGGMATVYLAEDVKHDRKVAVKVLRPELAAVLGAERFLNEIKVTANLQHPHILPLHDSGEAEGFVFYVMPYVEGESLRDKLSRETQLSIEESLKVTSEVADALGSAHRQGVVHRDIKPENILLSEGHALVADFGIALAMKSAGGERLTETGLSLGTPSYMSPEQIAGDREIDGRSDIYSLACVLYEMLAGEPPFTGPNAQAIVARHMTDPVPPITTVRSSVPQPVAAAITKALGKAPIDRFESAKAFVEALCAESADAEPEVKSIVVLPFENLSPDPDNAFFADGLTEEIIADLSKVRSLRVISRTSAMAFQGSTKTVPAIARELNVRHVLEGSVRRAGNSLRITAQLIDAENDAHMWAEKYSGTLEDVFDLQEQLSRQIVEVLQATLTEEADRRLGERPIPDLRALDCYLKAWQEMRSFTEEGVDQSIQLANEALDSCGDNALLYATLAMAYFQYYNAGVRMDEVTLRQADAFAARALEIDADLPQAYVAKGMVAYSRADFSSALVHCSRAVELDPNSEGLLFLGLICAYSGKAEVARQYSDRLVAVDPLSGFTFVNRGIIELVSGNFDSATAWFQRNLDAAPEDMLSLFWKAISTSYTGAHHEAGQLFTQVINAADAEILRECAGLWKAALLRDRGSVCQVATDWREQDKRDTEMSWYLMDCLAHVGEENDAMDWLETIIERGFCNHRFFSELDPFLAPLRGEVRFKELMERAREKQEAFAV